MKNLFLKFVILCFLLVILAIPISNNVLYYFILPGALVILIIFLTLKFPRINPYKRELRKKLKEYKVLLKVRGGL